MLWRVLDIFFFVFHTAFILFILLGWMWRRTRKAHLAAVLATMFSWCILGIWFGFGYCPCTDWHWEVRMRLGDYDLPYSYIKFLIDKATGWDVNATLVDGLTMGAFILTTAAAVYFQFRATHGERL